MTGTRHHIRYPVWKTWLLALPGLLALASAQGQEAGEGCTCAPSSFLANFSLNDACRLKTVDCILEDADGQPRFVAEMVDALEDGSLPEGAAATAVWLLGELRAEAAVGVLVRELDVSYLGPLGDLPYRMADPPEALVRIGRPAAVALVEAASEHPTAQSRQVIAGILYQIFGNGENARAFLDGLDPAFTEDHTRAVMVLRDLLHETK